MDTYAWTFGDGNTSTEANPTHTYTTGGTYTVELTVTDQDGLASATATTQVTIEEPANEAPVAVIGDPPVVTGMDVEFVGSDSFDPDGTVDTYAWTFGDGNTSTEANPTHTYTTGGTYTVELTVTDQDGLASATATTQVTIEEPANEAPVAVIGDPPVVTGMDVAIRRQRLVRPRRNCGHVRVDLR